MDNINILILGGGARERVIAEKLCLHNVIILASTDFHYISDYCNNNNINIVIPGSETYLCNGITDHIHSTTNALVFGPNQEQAQLEGSKYLSKKVMLELQLPTASFMYYDREIRSVVDKYDWEKYPGYVIKYSGLANGKGVYLPNTKEEALDAINKLYELNENNWEGLVIEKRLYGNEISVMGFCNGHDCFLMPQAQDYKRFGDGDMGLNTGGMGAICPVHILNDDEIKYIEYGMRKIVKKFKYIGVLYAGIMKTTDGIFFLEFNCRFGDPEAQVILNLLDTNLYTIIQSCINEKFIDISWKTNYAAAVVLSHKDYPISKLKTPVKIQINELEDSCSIYDSNVIYLENIPHTTGGRVMTLVSSDDTLELALQNIYKNIHNITYTDIHYRTDIGSNNII